jgi:hypothetical protein
MRLLIAIVVFMCFAVVAVFAVLSVLADLLTTNADQPSTLSDKDVLPQSVYSTMEKHRGERTSQLSYDRD